ncbi:MAG: hypothetical protein ACI4JU_03435 [Angelakisella sp.]
MDPNNGEYSLMVNEKGNRYVQADRVVIDENSNLSPSEQVEYYIVEAIANGVGVRIPTVEGDVITIDPRTAHKVVDKGYNSHGKRYWLNKSDYSVKLEAAAHIDELISASAAQHDGAVIGNTKDRTNKKVKAENGWKYRTAYFKNSNGDIYKINISIAQDGEIELAYSIGKPINKKRTADGNALSGGDMGSKATSAIPNNILPQTEPAVNSYSMQTKGENTQDGEHVNTVGYSKKEANRLLHRDGLQLPRRNTAVDFDTINVPQNIDGVNSYSMQNPDIDAQGDLSLMDTLPQEKPPQQETQQP